MKGQLILVILSSIGLVAGVYLPGTIPNSFKEGEIVKLKVDKITSNKHRYVIDHYDLPFCEPRDGVKVENENLSELVHGNRLENLPYRIQMKRDVFCEQVCISNVGRKESKRISPSKVVRAIRKRYNHNWIVDNLPAASEMKDSETGETKHFLGVPLGFVYRNKAYINNHVNINLEYHTVEDPETNLEEYRIVKFTIEPLSIGHVFKPIASSEDEAAFHKKIKAHEKVAEMIKPILSCDYSLDISLLKHTSFDMVDRINGGPGLQPASRHVLFTYDVVWTENEDLTWTSRWDLYLALNDAETSGEVDHWMTISNSLVIVVFVTSAITLILFRSLRQDYDVYCRPSSDEERMDEEELKSMEVGWNQVCADVFRPPPHPFLLSVFVGTGIQLLLMTFLTVVFAILGTFSPDEREALITTLISFYVLMGGIAGYTVGRLYKTFECKEWQKAAAATSLGYPSLVFATTCFMNLLAIRQSDESIAFMSMIDMFSVWLGVSAPLVFLGCHYGYSADGIEFPVNTALIPRHIPKQPWFMNALLTSAFGGFIPFGACFFEVSFLMSSLWIDEYYYVFSFLFFTLFCVLTTCAETTILFNYLQLRSEDYRWWWRSFITSGFTAVYIFLYALYYSTKLESNNPITYVYYFGYMSLFSVGILLMTGSVGLLSSLWFNHRMYKVYICKSLKMS